MDLLEGLLGRLSVLANSAWTGVPAKHGKDALKTRVVYMREHPYVSEVKRCD